MSEVVLWSLASAFVFALIVCVAVIGDRLANAWYQRLPAGVRRRGVLRIWLRRLLERR